MKKPTNLYFLFLCLILSTTLITTIPTRNASNIDQTSNLFKLVKSKSSRHSSLSTSWVGNPTLFPLGGVHVETQDGLMEADKISSLPGQPPGVDFDQYSGYVTVDPVAGKGLFYYFVESPHNASDKPLVLWLNGGPGCSSLEGGFLELGPFRVDSNGKSLIRNKYSWNNVANVIFLESPAGVGFSYGNVSTIYNQTGDISTAKDAYTFLANWLERFPQYKNRDFYITGESYAGHYVPQLAHTILHNNKMSKKVGINLKGIAVGNPYIDSAANAVGMFEILWSHAMYSDETHSKIMQLCNFSASQFSKGCRDVVQRAADELGAINIDHIYAPRCRNSGQDKTTHAFESVEVFDPCASIYVNEYLNSKGVQKTLHAKPTNWLSCRNFDWKDSPSTVLPVVQKLIKSQISIWIYSGDVDANCPVTSTKYSINDLKLRIKSPWRPWYTDEQVGGYVVEYEGLVFVTVRGAGHLVPSYQPQRALTTISSFLKGTLPPQS